MKPKETTGENGDGHETSLWDILIECIKSIKEFAIHVVDSEKNTPAGQANLIVIFAFLVFIFLYIIMQFFDAKITIPLIFYIFIVIGMISCIISSDFLVKIKEDRLQHK